MKSAPPTTLPRVADSRRIVEEALRNTFNPEDLEDDDPWRPPQAD